MKKLFEQLLLKYEIYNPFTDYFGLDFEAKAQHKEGWWFTEDTIQYRECDRFPDHTQGYNWRFQDDGEVEELLHQIFMENGFTVIYNESDEEDTLYIVKLLKNL